MGSIRELRKICQLPRKSNDTWHGRNIARRVSIYITVFFVKLGISANAATAIFLGSGILGALTLIQGDRGMVLLGSFILQIWYILDHVDGEVARLRGQTSITGVFFDHMCHYIVHPMIFFCLGFGVFLRTDNVFMIALGILSGFSVIMISAITDVYESFLPKKENNVDSSQGARGTERGALRKIFSCMHGVCTFPVIINLLLAFALLDIIFKLNAVVVFLIFYALAATLVWSFKLFYLIASKKLDKEISAYKEG